MITFLPSSPTVRHRRGVLRSGRVLVECCVALVLLSVCSTLLLLSADGTATLVDAAFMEDRVQRVEATVAARVQQDACAAGAPTLGPQPWGPRLDVTMTSVATDSLLHVDVAAIWQATALAWFAGRSVAVSTAGVCE